MWRNTAETEDNHVLEIAQKAGKIDIPGTHALDNFSLHSVHNVAKQCDRSDDSTPTSLIQI